MMNLSETVIGAIKKDSGGKSLEDFFDKNNLVGKLEKSDCIDFLKNEVNNFVSSNLTNKLGVKVSEQREYLKGSVYGYVLAKSEDRNLAIKASILAIELSKKYNKEI
mgnify:CR=1 FL=1